MPQIANPTAQAASLPTPSSRFVGARVVVLAAVIGAFVSCGSKEKAAPPPATPTPSSTVALSPDAIRAAAIETAVVGETSLARTLTLTGTIAAKPWITEE